MTSKIENKCGPYLGKLNTTRRNKLGVRIFRLPHFYLCLVSSVTFPFICIRFRDRFRNQSVSMTALPFRSAVAVAVSVGAYRAQNLIQFKRMNGNVTLETRYFIFTVGAVTSLTSLSQRYYIQATRSLVYSISGCHMAPSCWSYI